MDEIIINERLKITNITYPHDGYMVASLIHKNKKKYKIEYDTNDHEMIFCKRGYNITRAEGKEIWNVIKEKLAELN